MANSRNKTAKCSVIMIYFREKIILNTDNIKLQIRSLDSITPSKSPTCFLLQHAKK